MHLQSVASVSALGAVFVATLAARLPPQEACQPFLENFIRTVHPVIPIFHIPTLRQECAEFWKSLSPSTSVESLIQTLGVLYTGAANSASVDDVAQSLSLFALYEEVFRVIEFSAFYATSASLQLLRGFVIVNSFRASQLAPFSAFGFLPQAIRFAQSLRLHIGQKKGKAPEIEARRRLWWHLVFLDVESTIASGLQGIIRPDRHTTELPSPYDDLAGSDQGDFSRLSSQSQQISSTMLATQGHYLWAQNMQRWSEASPNQDEVVRFKRDIEGVLELLSDTKEDEWARLYLEMQIDRAYCMLGLRFWQLEQFKGTGCHSEVVR